MPLAVIGVILLVVIVVTLWITSRQAPNPRQLAIRTQAAWHEAGQTVRFGPVEATWYGLRGQDSFRGVLAILDESLIFTTRAESPPDLAIPLDTIRWIGFWQDLWAYAEKRAVRLQVEGPDAWQVLTFVLRPVEEFAQQLSQAIDLPVDYSGGSVESGPIRAERLLLDGSGQWQPDHQGMLFLAPDRLLFDWREPVFLASVRRLEVIASETANPLAADLLRVDYDDAQGTPHSVGFRIQEADDWAEMIRLRTDAPPERSPSRQKKDED